MENFFDETCAEDGWPDVAVYLSNVLKKSIFLLNINTTVTLSSDIKFDRSLSAQDKVLEMVGALNGTEYVNPVGGQSLYETSAFTSQDIELKFFRSELLNIYNTSSILVSSPQFLYHKFLVSLIRFQEQVVAYQARGVA